MADYSDLIKEFGSASKQEAVTTPHADLINEFGSGETSAKFVAPEAPVKIPNVQSAPSSSQPDNSAFTEFKERTLLPISRVPGKINEFINTLPKEYMTDIKSANKSLSGGLNDMTHGQPFTGLGETALGTVQELGAGLGLNTAARVFGEQAGKIVGNKEFGDKVSLLPIGLPAASKTAGFVSSKIPSNKAMDVLVEGIGPENLASVTKQLRENPRLDIYDVSPGAQQMAQKLILTEGNHQNKFAGVIEDRAGTAKGAVTSAIDSTMGAPVNEVTKLAEMKAAAQKVGKENIEPFVKKAGPVDVTDVVKHIDDAISSSGPTERATLKALKAGEQPTLPLSEAQSKLFNVREKLRGDWKDRDAMFLDAHGEQGLHQVQKDLRYEAQSLLDSQIPADRALGAKLMTARNKMVDAIDAKAPGYKEGLGKYADEMNVQEAYDFGKNILKNKDRPEYLEAKWATAKDAEKEAIREGTRIAYDTALGTVKNAARKGTDLLQVDFNTQNLKTIFGEGEASKMIKTLNDERKMADSNVKLLGNSQTAMRMKNDAKIDLPVEKSISPVGYGIGMVGELAGSMAGYPGIGGAIIAGNAARDLTHVAKIKMAKMKNNSLTDLMTAKGEAREQLIQALEQRIPQAKPSLLTRVQNTMLPIAAP